MRPASEAWPRAVRLKRQRLIRPLFSRTRGDVSTVVVGSVRLLYRMVSRDISRTTSPWQVGFAVSRAKNAVARNAMRRVLREAFRTSEYRHGLCVPPGYTLTMMVVCKAAHAKRQVHSDMLHALYVLTVRLKKEYSR